MRDLSACLIGLVVSVLVTALCGIAVAQDRRRGAVEIPLDKIWGYNMPGTRDLQKAVDRRCAKQIEAIRQTLSHLPQGKDAGKGIAVVGAGVDALAEAYAVLTERRKQCNTLPVDSEISILFYSYQSGYYVHLHSVSREGNNVEVQYRFVPHKSTEMTEHFALIPLGRITPGQVRVEVKQASMPEEFLRAGWTSLKPDDVKRIVCKSFSFMVE